MFILEQKIILSVNPDRVKNDTCTTDSPIRVYKNWLFINMKQEYEWLF